MAAAVTKRFRGAHRKPVTWIVPFLLICAPAWGADTETGSANTDQLPEVTINARREAVEKEVHTFVGKLTHSRRFSAESVPRWTQPLCFLASGLPRSHAEFVVARLSKLALSIGARLQKVGCSRSSANFLVVFTPKPLETLKYLNHHPALLFHGDARPQQINSFLSPPESEVVRVWHNAEVRAPDGTPLDPGGAGRCAQMPGVSVNCAPKASRVASSASQVFTQALVIVDSTRLQGIQLGQISDYIAMAGLVDLDLDTDFSDAPSILRLFSAPPDKRPEGLTDWDRAFLSALYQTDQGNPLQRGQIVTKMVGELAH